MGLVEQLSDLKDKAASLERRRARREADMEMARSRRDEAMEALRSQYGVDDLDGATALLRDLAGEVSDEMAVAQAALEEVPE
jgi:hypothetical protein